MHVAIGLFIATSITVVGFLKVAWPALLAKGDGDAVTPPTAAEVRQSWWQGIVMIALGLIGLYAILTWDGTPPEFIGV